MQIVIEISKEVNEIILNTSFIVDFEIMMKQTAKEREQTNAIFSLIDAIRNGTPLPEHYGRLIDADAFLAWLIFKGYIDNAKCGEVAEAIRKTTIIPVTKEKSCATCGQPRDYIDQCILFKEGNCIERYEKWKSSTKEGE